MSVQGRLLRATLRRREWRRERHRRRNTVYVWSYVSGKADFAE